MLRIADWVFRVLHPQGVPLSLRERESMSAKLLIAVECEGSQSSGFETAARSQEPVPESALLSNAGAYVRKTRLESFATAHGERSAPRSARRELVRKRDETAGSGHGWCSRCCHGGCGRRAWQAR